MAEKEKVNRSQAIRDYLKSVKPSERGPRAVCEALKAKGVNVSAQLVSQVKNSISGKKKKRTLSKARNQNAKKPNSNFDTWIFAKNLLNSVGGDLASAKKNLEIISKLLS
jgi:hypothetical protein